MTMFTNVSGLVFGAERVHNIFVLKNSQRGGYKLVSKVEIALKGFFASTFINKFVVCWYLHLYVYNRQTGCLPIDVVYI